MEKDEVFIHISKESVTLDRSSEFMEKNSYPDLSFGEIGGHIYFIIQLTNI